MKTKSKPCPDCGLMIDPCGDPVGYKNWICGEWDCAYHAHLRKDCPSEAGIRYRKKVGKWNK